MDASTRVQIHAHFAARACVCSIVCACACDFQEKPVFGVCMCVCAPLEVHAETSPVAWMCVCALLEVQDVTCTADVAGVIGVTGLIEWVWVCITLTCCMSGRASGRVHMYYAVLH